MSQSYQEFYPGLGQSVAERSILRRKNNGEWETWGDVAERVALGNVSILEKYDLEECKKLEKYIAKAALLMSGRHLQHGDAFQNERNMEVFTNCSTSAASHLKFYLLLNGSGVGRSYDDDLMLIDWANAPELVCCLDPKHPDFDEDLHITPKEAQSLVKDTSYLHHSVADSREGWAKSLELWENLAFNNPDNIQYLVLDFTFVRPKGSPIKGMQERPASGPAPTIKAFEDSNKIRKSFQQYWKITMYIDHYFADCVRVGGARRAARIATKYWKDKGIFDFIKIKNEGDLWSANNSVTVDQEFWLGVVNGDEHAVAVFEAIKENSYGTGEPGIINIDRLHQDRTDFPERLEIGSQKYQISKDSDDFFQEILKVCKNMKYYHIVNPCGEISLAVWGGFCVIADTAPYFCNTLDEAEDVMRTAVRSLMRVNTMDSIFGQEVKRTNRIGVGMTGVFEFAWKFFGYGFRDLIDEEKSKDFWQTIRRFGKAVEDEAEKYAKILGVKIPHTALTVKPAGTTSKLFGLTEGWHLASMDFYLRWVQFKNEDKLVDKYKKLGYPSKELKKYNGTTIIGFPTSLEISQLGLKDKLVLAGEASPEEQYKWLMLGEKYWLGDKKDNQISYTLKYDPKVVTKKEFGNMLQNYQSKIKCCSVMPQDDDQKLLDLYEYLPEEKIEWENYVMYKQQIKEEIQEDIGVEHLDCGSGGCPIDFRENKT